MDLSNDPSIESETVEVAAIAATPVASATTVSAVRKRCLRQCENENARSKNTS